MAQRVAVVTGGMGGLGEAICMRLADQGCKVVATHSPGNKKVAEWTAEMKAKGYTFYTVSVDVTDYDSCASAMQ
ncbi:MAG: beta-ketoacyl-ACP reductase, partial [Azospira oryzae]